MDENKRDEAARQVDRALSLVDQLKALIGMVREETTHSREVVSRLNATDRKRPHHDR